MHLHSWVTFVSFPLLLQAESGTLTDGHIIFLRDDKSIKCYIWMPWVEKPKKDVIGCEKPR